MDPKKLFLDARNTNVCVYCGSRPGTADHAPSKVLLDQPYPKNLPVVPSCEKCNNSFSKDELYLACFIECTIHGTVDHEQVKREKIKRILSITPKLAATIEACRHTDNFNNLWWTPDFSKIKNVILKLARGHAAYECGELQLNEPERFFVSPLCTMSMEGIQQFNTPPIENIWPEIGSRAFMRAVGVNSDVYLDDGWQVIQPARYRYLVSDSGSIVRIVLSEYLACEISW